MNLFSGNILDAAEGQAALEQLEKQILKSREEPSLPLDAVIAACDSLVQRLNESEHLPLLMSLGIPEYRAARELQALRRMLSRDSLEARLSMELGGLPVSFIPHGEQAPVRQAWKPLGVLLHIAAGNADALPAYSVIEGLLTGNINILKLPEGDDGLSVLILQELIETEPLLSPYIFVFDCSSRDTAAMRKLASAADAIVTWGGDAAVSAIRALASPDTRLIEWGHKLSFAYVSGEASDIDLEGVAWNICDTNQLLCSSCQGIFLDTDDFEAVSQFAERFLHILTRVAASMPEDRGPYFTARQSLALYTEALEAAGGGKRVFRDAGGSSVIAYKDMSLTPSLQFRSCWLRPLPRRRILEVLSPYKNHLQTAALVCEPQHRGDLEALLSKTGLVRITSGKRMSKTYCGQPHDGEFPLRRYLKRISYED